MTTVACVLVKGEYPYTVQWVTRLRAMVDRWIDRPFAFVCLTDCPDECLRAGIDAIPITKLAGFAYWTKLELFNPARGLEGRVLYLDLDVLIVAPLAPIIDAPAPFAITSDLTGKTGRDKFGRQIIRRFNSSVMAWTGGTQTHLYQNWTPDVAWRLSGDQDFLAEQAPDAYAMNREWFPRLSEINGPPFGEAKVILSKSPKNDIAITRYPWFSDYWGAA